jgi:plastocyanin
LSTSSLALVNCGGGSSAITIAIDGPNGTQAFSPNHAAFGGQAVVFKNNDSVTHRVVLNDGSIDTGDIAGQAPACVGLYCDPY